MSANASRKRAAVDEQDNGLLLCDEVRSEDGSVHESDDEFLNDSEISANSDDYRAIDGAVNAAMEGVLSMGGEEVSAYRPPRGSKRVISNSSDDEAEVSVQASKAIKKNKRKADNRVKAKKRTGVTTKVAKITDRGHNMKNWCFTVYDCPEFNSVFLIDDDQFVAQAANSMVQIFATAHVAIAYLCVGKESCPTTNRLHLQCFVQFTTKKRMSSLSKVASTIHWESCKGTPRQNREYCRGIHPSKSLTVPNALFSEFGVIPLTGSEATQNLWQETLDHARKNEMLSINPRILITQVKNLEHIQRKFGLRAEFVNPLHHTGVWIYSTSSGRGKTDCLKEQFPSIYLKAADTHWNDYSGEEHALIDDFALGDAKTLAASLKLWCHHQSFKGRVLYGTVTVHLRRLFVTSNYSLERLFCDMGPEVYEPIRLRFRQFNWDLGNLSWDQRAKDCWSETNILKCPLGEIYDGVPF